MDYRTLLEFATEIGYRLAMSGAETFRVEESIRRILAAYEIESEVFAIPNCLTVSMETPDGQPMTRMRRIGFHGNDLDTVEKYNNLSRRICAEKPDPQTAWQWIRETGTSLRSFRFPILLLGHFLGAFGFCIVFGGSFADSICSGICGILIGLGNRFFEKRKVNPFFTTIASAFIMTFAAQIMRSLALSDNSDTAIIGALMILVPGLMFTNAMRDIIFGDTNSGINRIVQVLLTAVAIALGTGAGWRVAGIFLPAPLNPASLIHPYVVQTIATLIACAGFSIIFNIHGVGILICALGGMFTWIAFCIADSFGCIWYVSFFLATVVAAAYAETMARVRKYPAISYLVIAIFPLIPGAGVYYATSYLMQGNQAAFAQKALQTIGTAGVIAVGILVVSTLARLLSVWRMHK